ncbi:MAG: ATP-dependent helicase [Acidobacteriota bacterium]|nr:ATP-dependent helicase [Acidobacteriota bacterium]
MRKKEAPWLEGIEGEEARELIESNSPVIRVVAGPGSGKTTCLKRRTRRLIEGDGINPTTMFVGTFTRAIASELKEALGRDVRVSTLHSLAYDLLRKNPAALRGMRLRFLLNFEQDALLYDIEKAARSIGNIYARREELRLLQASRSQRANYVNAAFAGAVTRWLQQHRSMLIGEVVFLCVLGLESEDIPSGEFHHVVIDEYQDLTAAEQELVGLVWSRKGSLTVMGDNDQSIYGFRFNHPKGISDFHKAWPEYECIDLTFSKNRRCGSQILWAANLMMAEAGSTKPRMLPQSGRRGRLTLVQWDTLDDEIQGLANYIGSHSGESFLVLVPRRFIGYRIAESVGEDARTAFTEEIVEHPIAQEAFTAASLLADSEDWVATRVWLGFHGTEPKQAVRRNALAYSGLSPDVGGHELIRGIASGDISVSHAGQTHVKRRAQKAIKLIEQGLDPSEVIDLIFCPASAELESDPEKQRWLDKDLRELRTAARKLLAAQDTPDLGKILNSMRYKIATRAPLTSDREEPRVRIMTLHSAKGLEADNVIVAGVADQLMPGRENKSKVVAEQRRLLYVAVTRAKDSLIVSWSRRVRFDDLMKNMGRTTDGIVTINGVRWARTSRSSLLPQGLTGVIAGNQWLSANQWRVQG